MIRSLFYRSGTYFFTLVIAKAITTILFIVVARLLQPQGFGDITLFITLLTLVTIISDFGLSQWYQKYTSTETVSENLNTLLSLRTYTQIFGLLLGILGLQVFGSPSITFSIVFLATLFFEGYLSVLDGFYLFNNQAKKAAYKQIIRSVFILLGIMWLNTSISVDQLLYLYLVATIITTLWYIPFQSLTLFKWSSRSTTSTVLRQSASYLVLITTSVAYSRGDSLIIKSYLTSSALGIYGAAYRYLESLSMLPTALAHNLFPLAAKKAGVNLTQALRITILMTFIGAFFAISLWFLAPLLTTGILGESYTQAIPIVKIFSLVLLLYFINSPLNTIIQSSDIVSTFLPFGIANTILNLILNLIFIPQYGLESAAWTMCVTECTGLLINLYFVRKIYATKT